MVGASLAHYKILERIGAGGMGEVFAADDCKLHRRVALKILPRKLASDPSRRDRFEREAKAVAALNHPNIVTIYSIDEAEGIQFLTMEFVSGKNLDHIIPEEGSESALSGHPGPAQRSRGPPEGDRVRGPRSWHGSGGTTATSAIHARSESR